VRQLGEFDEEQRSYSAIFLIGVGLLLAGALWSIWDDNISRRPWKKWQAEFFQLQIDQARRAVRDEEARLARDPQHQDVVRTLSAAEKKLASGETARELKRLRKALEQQKVRTSELDLELRIAKSKIEEAWYEYDHAIATGQPTDEAKAHLEELQKERDELAAALQKSESKEAEIQTQISAVEAEKAELEKKKEAMESELRRLRQRLAGLTLSVGPFQFPKIPRIEQVVLAEFDRGNFNTPLNRVDRCTSCHAAIDKPGFEDRPNPLKTHPHLDLLRYHPGEKFGCTPCHGGQGPAVNSPEQAHGEVHFWDQPLRRGELVQASCIQCHQDTRGLAYADVIARGQTLFEELGCHGCHLTEGYENLEKVGPSLRRLAAKVDPSWLVGWVERPHRYRPRTRMPDFLFDREQATAVAAYLLDASRAESEEWSSGHPEPEAVDPKNPELVAEGRRLVETLGCRGCHGLEPDESPGSLGANKDIAPNLSAVAEKSTPRWIYHWIKSPRGYSPVARMPSLRLSDREAAAIASYLATRGTPKPDPAVVARLRDPAIIETGKSLVRKYGCFGCHDIPGMENESRVGVELSAFGSKTLEELFFGNHTDIPHTWEDWTYHKLRDPRTYATERIEQQMPNFNLEDADIRALRVFLKSRTEEKIPVKYAADANERGTRILAGRRLVQRYNCTGCHVIEGRGGDIRAFYAEQPTMAPPVLTGEGAKVQSDWLFGFLKEPVPLRPWLQVRMPTFGLSDREATTLVEYFGTLDHVETPFVHVVSAEIPPEYIEAGRQLASKDYFDCFSCHQRGSQKPEGPLEGWAPDLALARQRLQPEWILRWLRDPQAVQPGTKMPSFFPGGPEDILGGNEDLQIRALRDYIMSLGEPRAVVARGPGPVSAEGGAEASVGAN